MTNRLWRLGRELGGVLACLGLTLASSLAQTTLVSTGSVWRYLADGTDAGAAWRQLDFDDSAWPSGPAQLGFGDGDEATVIGQATNRFITFYFRHPFLLTDEERGGVTNLLASLRRDDGAVVYLNGTEVMRSHLPTGPLNYLTLAPTAAADDGRRVFLSGINAALLLPGTNLLAVEVHQNSRTSSDLSFDLALTANTQVPLIAIGSRWLYQDDGTDPETAWTELDFNDSTWAEGLAKLGFDEGDESTFLARTNQLGAANLAFFFRQRFTVAAPDTYSNLVLRLQRDDGAAVYLNGVEILRDNLPSGPLAATNLAVAVVEDSTFHASPVDPALLRPGENVMAVRVHQAVATSSDIAFDLELMPNVPPTPPVLVLSGLADGAVLDAPGKFTVRVQVTDADDRVERVEFYLGNNLMTTRMPSVYDASATWAGTNLAPGDYLLSAVAVDTSALRSTSGPVQFSVRIPPQLLLAAGAEWKYLDTGADAGTAWREPGFPDLDWPKGSAPLGFDDPWMATVLQSNRTDNSRILTYYFRRPFTVANATGVTNLLFRVLRDDGAVAYLNGREVFRMNMSSTAIITAASRASTAVGGTNESFYFPTNIQPARFPSGLLVEGTNLLAVEVHQVNSSSSDLGFDLELLAAGTPTPVESTLILSRIEVDGAPWLRLTWDAPDMILEAAESATGPWDPLAGNPASPFQIPATGAAQFYRLRR